jgi:hypothetical protein
MVNTRSCDATTSMTSRESFLFGADLQRYREGFVLADSGQSDRQPFPTSELLMWTAYAYQITPAESP